jgi:aspartate/methionine/tyrosine aminotransferase
MYKDQIELADGKVVVVETYENELFQINIDRLNKYISSKTKAILINTPNNPTGVCYSESHISELGKIAEKNDFLIISDEVYDAYSYEKPFKPIAKVTKLNNRVVTVGSFSKGFAMTGWRIGFILAPEYLISCMKILNESICYAPSSISQRAAIYALKHRKSIQEDIIREYRNRVYYSYNRAKSIKNLKVLKPSGAIYLFVNIRATGLTSEEFKTKLLREQHVKVISGAVFGDVGEGYVRIACTLPIEKLQIAFDRIESFCNNCES